MREYMHGTLTTTDDTKIEIKNIIAVHAQPTTELTQVWVHEGDKNVLKSFENFKLLQIWLGDYLYKTIGEEEEVDE